MRLRAKIKMEVKPTELGGSCSSSVVFGGVVVSGAVVSGVSFSSVLCVVADVFGSGDGVSELGGSCSS